MAEAATAEAAVSMAEAATFVSAVVFEAALLQAKQAGGGDQEACLMIAGRA